MTRKYFSPKRSAAKQARLMAESNQKKKYQGLPCKHGHSGIRFTQSGECVECAGKHRVSYYAKLKQRIVELEAENATLRHQHGNDEAANKMLVELLVKSEGTELHSGSRGRA